MTSRLRTGAVFRAVLWLAAATVALTIAGCASSQKIGTGVKLGKSGNANLSVGGSNSPSPRAAAKAKAKPRTSSAPAVRRTTQAAAPRQTTAAQPKPKPFMIVINGDTSGKPAFDPGAAAVYVGTEIVWVNHDTQPRGVIAQNGAFHSPPIPPGKSYTWVAKAAGTYSYQDTTRPYVDAQIQVYPK